MSPQLSHYVHRIYVNSIVNFCDVLVCIVKYFERLMYDVLREKLECCTLYCTYRKMKPLRMFEVEFVNTNYDEQAPCYHRGIRNNPHFYKFL